MAFVKRAVVPVEKVVEPKDLEAELKKCAESQPKLEKSEAKANSENQAN